MLKGRNIEDIDLVELRRSIGFVFQNYALFPHMPVADNVGITLRLLGRSEMDIERRVVELLEMVNLPPSDFRGRLPSELSGGQRQRVGFARALAAEPALILMDEPFGALDPLTRESLRAEFERIQGNLGFSTVMVTHDMAEALALADQIIVLKDGKVEQKGAPREVLNKPGSEYVSELISAPLSQASRVMDLTHAQSGQGDAQEGR